MDNAILLTILVILGLSIVGMVLNRRTKDRCLKDFGGFLTTMQEKSGKRVWGSLRVEPTGIEFCYEGDYWDRDHIETSFIVYKQEFPALWALFRFHDELDAAHQALRLRQLERSFHPGPWRRLARGLRNLASSLKDAFGDITGVILATASARSPAGRALATQQKQVTQVQGGIIGLAGAAYDPILERHIGRRVVLEIVAPSGEIQEHVGVLKEYSAEFVEVLDLRYPDGGKGERVADVIVPRTHGAVRHSNESVGRPSEWQRGSVQDNGAPAASGPTGAATDDTPGRHSGGR